MILIIVTVYFTDILIQLATFSLLDLTDETFY
jgi:hypothetical protein